MWFSVDCGQPTTDHAWNIRRYLINTGLFLFCFFNFHFVFWFLCCLFCRLVICTWTSQPERERDETRHLKRYHERSNEETPKVHSIFYQLRERMRFAAFTRLQRREWWLAGNEVSETFGKFFLAPVCISADRNSGIDRHKTDGILFLQSEFLLWKC